LVTVDKVLRMAASGCAMGEHSIELPAVRRGFAITSYASQGKTVDYVLFSDSTIKPRQTGSSGT
jgi:hypothetical protein